MDKTEIAVAVNEAVNTLFFDKKMFTAYDITKMIRAKVGKGVSVSHDDVKNAVHEMFENSVGAMKRLYRINVCINPAVGASAWLYYEDYYSITDYDPDAIRVPNFATDVEDEAEVEEVEDEDDAKADAAVEDDRDPTAKYDIAVDNRGRICIPNFILKAAGALPGDTVYAAKNIGKIWIDPPAGVDNYDEYIVDKSGNVRVSGRKILGMECEIYYIKYFPNNKNIVIW